MTDQGHGKITGSHSGLKRGKNIRELQPWQLTGCGSTGAVTDQAKINAGARKSGAKALQKILRQTKGKL